MFFTRRDGGESKRAARRVKSPRASVYLEFAVVMPIVAMLIAFIFEFVSLWDARIMANHTAWVCSRIASVEAGNEYAHKESVAPNRLLTDGMKTATKFLMSTCSMGGMGSRVGSQKLDAGVVTDVVEGGYKGVVACFSLNVVEQISNTIEAAFGADEDPATFIGKIKKLIVEKLVNAIKLVLQPIEDLINKIANELVFGGVDIGTLSGALKTDSRLIQLGTAEQRLSKYCDSIFDIRERDDSTPSRKMYFRIGSGGEFGLDFPRQASAATQKNKWMLSTDQGWPPKEEFQRMIDVRIYWPFEHAWLWQALSLSTPKTAVSSGNSYVAAHGRALAYPQPIICNDNLKSEGAVPFAEGDSSIQDAIADIQSEYNNFLKTVWFWYYYRTREEYVGGFELENTGKTKALHFISKGFEGDIKKARVNWDGLYNWMTGLIDAETEADLRSGAQKLGDDWAQGLRDELAEKFLGDDKYRPQSYLTSFNKFFDGTKVATNSYWYSSVAHYYKPDNDLRNKYAYREKDWFYWTADGGAEHRLRLAHWTADAMTDTYYKDQHDYFKYRDYVMDGKGSKSDEHTTVSANAFLVNDKYQASDFEDNYNYRIRPKEKVSKDIAPEKIKAEIKNFITGYSGYQAWVDHEHKTPHGVGWYEWICRYCSKGFKESEKDEAKKSTCKEESLSGYVGLWYCSDGGNYAIVDHSYEARKKDGYWVCKTCGGKDEKKNATWCTFHRLDPTGKWKYSASGNKMVLCHDLPKEPSYHYEIGYQILSSNRNFPNELNGFVDAAYKYYSEEKNNMYDKPAYRLSAYRFIKNTASDQNASLNADNAAYNALRNVRTNDAATVELITKCRKELGQSLGMDTEDSSTSIGIDLMSDSTFAELQNEKYMQDPQAMHDKAKELLDKQKQDVYSAIKAVDEAEQALLDFNAEQKFQEKRDARLNAMYKWLANEIVVKYGNSIGWNYNGYDLSFIRGATVQRNNPFKAQTDAFNKLAADWNAKIAALQEKDRELGDALGLKTTQKTKSYANNTGVNTDKVEALDANTPGGTQADDGSKDDKRGGAWIYDSSSRRWRPDPAKKDDW